MKALIAALSLLAAGFVYADVVPGVTDVRPFQHEGKTVELLTDVKGLSLYTFDPDGPNQSNCYDGCAKAWPPILISAEVAATLEDGFSSAKRKDGTIQLTFDSKPLYLYVGDKKPGDIKGDGLGGVWHLAIDEDK